MSNEDDTRRLVVAITDFLRDHLSRVDLSAEDRDSLEIGIECLEMAFGLETNDFTQLRFARPLLDIFSQVANPVTVKDKLEAERQKNEGNEKMSQQQYQEAVEAYSRAIELDKWNSIYYCNRAGACIELNNYLGAITDCRQALMLNPDYAKAYGRMGQAYALMNRPRRAARCFRQALEQDPDNEKYRNNLRVAESQIPRASGLGLIGNVLNSLFGMRPSNPNGTDMNNGFIPPSFMIITEAHATPQPTSGGQQPSTETLESPVSSETSIHQEDTQRNTNYPSPDSSIPNEVYRPTSFETVRDDSDGSERAEDPGEYSSPSDDEEIFIQIPFASMLQGFYPVADPYMQGMPTQMESTDRSNKAANSGQSSPDHATVQEDQKEETKDKKTDEEPEGKDDKVQCRKVEQNEGKSNRGSEVKHVENDNAGVDSAKVNTESESKTTESPKQGPLTDTQNTNGESGTPAKQGADEQPNNKQENSKENDNPEQKS